MQISGASIIVTGSGKGIGRDVAITLARRKARVVLCSRTEADLLDVSRAIEDAGGTCTCVVADLTDEVQVRRLVSTALLDFGSIDALVNNAGGFPSSVYDASTHRPRKLWDWDVATWARSFALPG